MTPCSPCVDSKRPRVYVQNVPVHTGTTRTRFNICSRGAGIHGDVLNVHTEAFLKPNTVFHVFLRAATHTKHTPRPPTTPRPQRHTPHNTTHNMTRRERKRDKTRQERTIQDKRRQDKRREEKMKRREEKMKRQEKRDKMKKNREDERENER